MITSLHIIYVFLRDALKKLKEKLFHRNNIKYLSRNLYFDESSNPVYIYFVSDQTLFSGTIESLTIISSILKVRLIFFHSSFCTSHSMIQALNHQKIQKQKYILSLHFQSATNSGIFSSHSADVRAHISYYISKYISLSHNKLELDQIQRKSGIDVAAAELMDDGRLIILFSLSVWSSFQSASKVNNNDNST